MELSYTHHRNVLLCECVHSKFLLKNFCYRGLEVDEKARSYKAPQFLSHRRTRPSPECFAVTVLCRNNTGVVS